MGNIITKCLEIAEALSLKSITFPAIGTGNLGFPRPVVAKLLFDKVFEFSSKNRVNSLEEVHFLLHPKDTANIQVSYHGFLSLLYADLSLSHDTWLFDDLQRIHRMLVLILKKKFAGSLFSLYRKFSFWFYPS